VQEEEGLKQGKKEAAKGPEQKKQTQESKCFFCNKTRHVKEKCARYHAWRAKKGMYVSYFGLL